MNLDESFERAKKEEEEKLEPKIIARCIACHFVPCRCQPMASMDQPYDCGYGV